VGLGLASLAVNSYLAQRLGVRIVALAPADLAAQIRNDLRVVLDASWLICLGVGSILLRRWARRLLLCFALIGLIRQVLLAPGTLLLLSELLSGGDRLARLRAEPLIIGNGVNFALYVSILYYYCRADVKRRFAASQPAPPWTDRRPLPIVACCVDLTLQGLTGLTYLGSVLSPLPPGGWLGARAAWAAALALLLVRFLAAWSVYRLDRRGWAILTATYFLFSAAALAGMVRGSQAGGSVPGWAVWNFGAEAFVDLGFLVCARMFFGLADGAAEPAG
jgi:hypothetical protein